jgi:hypothetical protein
VEQEAEGGGRLTAHPEGHADQRRRAQRVVEVEQEPERAADGPDDGGDYRGEGGEPERQPVLVRLRVTPLGEPSQRPRPPALHDPRRGHAEDQADPDDPRQVLLPQRVALVGVEEDGEQEAHRHEDDPGADHVGDPAGDDQPAPDRRQPPAIRVNAHAATGARTS